MNTNTAQLLTFTVALIIGALILAVCVLRELLKETRTAQTRTARTLTEVNTAHLALLDKSRKQSAHILALQVRVKKYDSKVAQLTDELAESATENARLAGALFDEVNAHAETKENTNTIAINAMQYAMDRGDEKTNAVRDDYARALGQVIEWSEWCSELETRLNNAERNLRIARNAHAEQVENYTNRIATLVAKCASDEREQEGLFCFIDSLERLVSRLLSLDEYEVNADTLAGHARHYLANGWSVRGYAENWHNGEGVNELAQPY